MSVNNIQLYAERHTGSKFLARLFEKNYKIDSDYYQFGWKHWFPNIHEISDAQLDQYLFVVLSRNVYDWIHGMHRVPHHTPRSFRNIDIRKFIQKEWISINDQLKPTNPLYNTEMIFDRNPETGERFKNIFELREYKNKYFLMLQNYVPNVKYIRYEDLLNKGEKIIKDISGEYNITLKKDEIYCNARKINLGKWLPNDVIETINDNTNWEFEQKLGYGYEEFRE